MASAVPRQLESYVYGAWTAGKGDGLPLLDAGTGETVALIDSKGLDFAEVLHYGRTVAGPAIGADDRAEDGVANDTRSSLAAARTVEVVR